MREHETRMSHDEAWGNLDAYLDGEVAANERWAVAAHLADCPACRTYAAEQSRLRSLVREQALAIQPPPALENRLRAALAGAPDPVASEPPKKLTWLPPRALWAAAILGPILVGMLLSRAAFPITATEPDLQSQMIVAHALFAQDTSKLDVEGTASTVEAWFRDEAGLSVTVPEISGYLFSGGRLLIVEGQPAAQLVYRSIPDGLYLSLLRFADRGMNLGDMEKSDGFMVGQQGPTSIITWLSGDDRTVLIGESPSPALRQVADDLSARLGPLPTVAPVEIRVLPGSNNGGPWADYPR